MADPINPFATGNTYTGADNETVYDSQADVNLAGTVYAPQTGTSNAGIYNPQVDALKLQGGEVSSLLNAQYPTPLAGAPTPNIMDTLLNVGAREPSQLMNAAASMPSATNTTGAPVSSLEPAAAIQPTTGYAPILPQAAPEVQAAPVATAPVVDATSQISAQGIMDPFAGSNSTAMKGISQAEQAGQLKAVAEHGFYQKKADIEKEAMDKQQALQEAFEFKYQEKMDDLTQSMKDFKALAGEKIVPAAFLARQDTSGSLMTGLAVALGGIGGALQGTNKNIGVEMIEKAIDRDVAAQQYNLEHKTRVGKANIDDQNSLLSKMREKFGDEKSAILATKLSMTEMVRSKMDQELTKKGGAVSLGVQSQANIARAQIMKQKEALELQLKAAQAQQYEKQQMMAGKNYYDLSNEQALASFGKDADKYVRGYGMATDPQLAKDFIQKVKPAEATIQKVKDVLTFAKGKGYSKLMPEDRAKMESMLTDLQLELKAESAYALGVLTGPDMELLNKITGDPTSLNPLLNSQARLEQLIGISQKKFDSKVKAYGFEPISQRAGSVDSKVIKNKP